MLKKIIAGVTAIALSIGMVALVAGPVSAHHNTISVAVSCNTGPSGFWKVTWSVTNSESDKSETITSSTDAALVPVGTVIGNGATATFIEYYGVKPAADKALTLGAQWSNGFTNSDSATLDKDQFSDDCVPDDTDKKVPVCHYDSGQGGSFTLGDIDVSAVLDGSGHAGHANDIIPPFDYVKGGVAGHYSGKNWDAYGQWVYANGCSNKVTPTEPTIADAVCTGPGTYGQGSYTIPVTTGVIYRVGSSAAGPWTTVGAGTHPVGIGTHVFLQAIAATGYVLHGTTAWDSVIGSPSDCREPVTAPASTFADEVCNPVAAGTLTGYYTVQAGAHVSYQVVVNGGSPVTKVAGSYSASVGDQVTITPVAEPGYFLTGDVGPWSHTFLSATDCDDDVTPVEPSFQDDVCTGEPGESTGATYTIPSTTGVQYQVYVLGSWIDRSAGTHPWIAGLTVQVRAVAESGYALIGTTSWSHEFDPAAFCLTDAVPVNPTVAPQTCVEDQNGRGSYVDGSITIVASTGVGYFIDGTPKAPGVHPYGPGTYAVTAEPQHGYTLENYPPGGWSLTVQAATACGQLEELGDVTPLVTFTQTTCSAAGSYTLAVMTDDDPAGVIWTVSDGLPNTIGTHAVAAAGTVNITATAAPGFGLSGETDGIIRWSYDFTSLSDNCLPTLALTGAPFAVGLVALWGVLTAVGVVLVTARRRELAGAE